MKGKVNWYNARKEYGFLVDEYRKDIFIHHTDLPTSIFLNNEDLVEYKIEDSERGKKQKM